MSALHHAVIHEQEEAVAFLANAFTQEMLDLGENADGHTALHKAILSTNREICITLVVRGASLFVKNYKGQTAEQLALATGQHELAATLLRKLRYTVSLEKYESSNMISTELAPNERESMRLLEYPKWTL